MVCKITPSKTKKITVSCDITPTDKLLLHEFDRKSCFVKILGENGAPTERGIAMTKHDAEQLAEGLLAWVHED